MKKKLLLLLGVLCCVNAFAVHVNSNSGGILGGNYEDGAIFNGELIVDTIVDSHGQRQGGATIILKDAGDKIEKGTKFVLKPKAWLGINRASYSFPEPVVFQNDGETELTYVVGEDILSSNDQNTIRKKWFWQKLRNLMCRIIQINREMLKRNLLIKKCCLFQDQKWI